MTLRRLQITFTALAAMAAGGCDLSLDPLRDDITGYYDYAGTVYDSPGHSVNGQIDIVRQYGHSADVQVEWNFYEGSRRIVHIESLNSVPAEIRSDGTIRFTVEGELELDGGGWSDFELTHDGRLDGRTLRGSWRLRTDLPSDDRGSFNARR